jgi:hypothetical protein
VVVGRWDEFHSGRVLHQRDVPGERQSALAIYSWRDEPDRDSSNLAAHGHSAHFYGSCRSLFEQRIGVGLPALVNLAGVVLVAAPP